MKLKIPISPEAYLITDDIGAGRCSIGISSFRKLSEEAGAVVKIGSRRLNNWKKITEYLDSISGSGINDSDNESIADVNSEVDDPGDESDQCNK